MTQVEMLSRAFAFAFVVVACIFFFFVLLKAPLMGAIKISIITIGWCKLAVVGLAAIVWLVLNYFNPD